MRFHLDEDLNPEIAAIARGLAVDVLSVHEIGRRGFPDDDQLRFSAAQARVFVTPNRDDFLRMTIAFFEAGEPHAGLLVVPRNFPSNRPARTAHALKRWDERPGDRGSHFIDFLSA